MSQQLNMVSSSKNSGSGTAGYSGWIPVPTQLGFSFREVPVRYLEQLFNLRSLDARRYIRMEFTCQLGFSFRDVPVRHLEQLFNLSSLEARRNINVSS